MRHVLLVDNKIAHDELERWKIQDRGFWKQHAGVDAEYEEIKTDYSDYPTYVDQDGDIRPTPQYLQSLTDTVVSRFGEFGTDFIMVMIHEDNFKSDPPGPGGIWGTAYAYNFGKQALLYCRWDKDNLANSFGTLYHERHHALDALIEVETGVKPEPLVPVVDWDREITHGKGEGWDYIRHQENTRSLELMKPYLQQAFKKRLEKHNEVIVGLMQTVVKLATELLYLLRARRNRKDGIPKL